MGGLICFHILILFLFLFLFLIFVLTRAGDGCVGVAGAAAGVVVLTADKVRGYVAFISVGELCGLGWVWVGWGGWVGGWVVFLLP